MGGGAQGSPKHVLVRITLSPDPDRKDPLHQLAVVQRLSGGRGESGFVDHGMCFSNE